jgi:hypothetical protein
MSLASFRDSFEVMAVAFLLAWIQIVVNGRTVADQGADKPVSQNIQGDTGRSTLDDHVTGNLGGRENM